MIDRRLFIVGTPGLLLTSCSSAEDIAAAERGAVRFRELMFAGQFSQIHAEATDEFRKEVTEPNLSKFLTAVVNKLGPVRSGWRINFRTSGTFVRLGFKTEFERGSGTEQFIFRIRRGAAALVRYDINSPALVIN